MAYEQEGLFEDALAELQKAMALSVDSVETMTAIGHVYAVSGRIEEARKVLEELKESSEHRHVSSYFIAKLYSGLREDEMAFWWLRKAIEERADWLIFLKVDPVFDSLRSDPGFTDLVERIGLAPS